MICRDGDGGETGPAHHAKPSGTAASDGGGKPPSSSSHGSNPPPPPPPLGGSALAMLRPSHDSDDGAAAASSTARGVSFAPARHGNGDGGGDDRPAPATAVRNLRTFLRTQERQLLGTGGAAVGPGATGTTTRSSEQLLFTGGVGTAPTASGSGADGAGGGPDLQAAHERLLGMALEERRSAVQQPAAAGDTAAAAAAAGGSGPGEREGAAAAGGGGRRGVATGLSDPLGMVQEASARVQKGGSPDAETVSASCCLWGGGAARCPLPGLLSGAGA